MRDSTKNTLLAFAFNKEIESLEKDLCPFCEKPINQKDFKDDLSRKEFMISGLCGQCQDLMFK